MSLEEDFKEFAKDMRKEAQDNAMFRGETRTGLLNLNAHVSAVSKKADSIRAELEAHKDSENAHGAGSMAKWAAVGISLVALVVAIVKLK